MNTLAEEALKSFLKLMCQAMLPLGKRESRIYSLTVLLSTVITLTTLHWIQQLRTLTLPSKLSYLTLLMLLAQVFFTLEVMKLCTGVGELTLLLLNSCKTKATPITTSWWATLSAKHKPLQKIWLPTVQVPQGPFTGRKCFQLTVKCLMTRSFKCGQVQVWWVLLPQQIIR